MEEIGIIYLIGTIVFLALVFVMLLVLTSEDSWEILKQKIIAVSHGVGWLSGCVLLSFPNPEKYLFGMFVIGFWAGVVTLAMAWPEKDC